MNKAELAATIADKVGVSKKEGEEMVAAFVETVTTTLVSGGEVAIAGFGAFSAKLRAGRVGVNPQNPTQKNPNPSSNCTEIQSWKRIERCFEEIRH